MPALKTFEVIFEEDRATYTPGSEVSGRLELDLEESMKVKEVKIQFVGKAHVEWREGGQHKIPFSGTKTYFKKFIVIPCEGKSLSQGCHSFAFRFDLPDGLPTSYEDEIGYVRYYVRATLEKPGLTRNQNTKSIFTVLKVKDLNTTGRDLTEPVERSNATTLCVLCCESGLIECDLRLDRLGYVPGEWLVIKGRLNNRSRAAIHKVSFELLQEVTYVATGSARVDRKVVAKEKGPRLQRTQALTLKGFKMKIPAVAPTEKDCPVLKIKYALMLEAHLPWYTANLRTYIPLVIGTIPLLNLPLYSSLKDKSDPPPDYPEVASPSHSKYAAEAPPPSYEEAFDGGFDGVDDEDDTLTVGTKPYIPCYTFYNWDEKTFSNMTFEQDE